MSLSLFNFSSNAYYLIVIRCVHCDKMRSQCKGMSRTSRSVRGGCAQQLSDTGTTAHLLLQLYRWQEKGNADEWVCPPSSLMPRYSWPGWSSACWRCDRSARCHRQEQIASTNRWNQLHHWHLVYVGIIYMRQQQVRRAQANNSVAPQNRQRSTDAKPDSFTLNPNKVMQQDLHVQKFLHLWRQLFRDFRPWIQASPFV